MACYRDRFTLPIPRGKSRILYQLGHNRFVPIPVHLLSYHSMLYSLDTNSAVRINHKSMYICRMLSLYVDTETDLRIRKINELGNVTILLCLLC
jgi:hypothetical protein